MRSDYEPSYPRALTPDEVRLLLRPGLLERFGQSTLLAGAVLVGSLVVVGGVVGGCDQAGATQPPPGANNGGNRNAAPPIKSTRMDPQLKARVDGIITEVLGEAGKRRRSEHTRLQLATPVAGNPPLKTPFFGVMFGNSYVGVFDTEGAREATRRLFKEYGIELEPRVRVKGDGFEFVADGYDPKRKIGFEIVDPGQPKRVRFADGAEVPASSAKVLEDKEFAAVGAAVKAGDVQMFVAPAAEFPNVDGDRGTSMAYYLASVVDYLNWVHGDQQIDRDRVLGKKPQPVEGRF